MSSQRTEIRQHYWVTKVPLQSCSYWVTNALLQSSSYWVTTASTVGRRLWQFKVMPFGFPNIPLTIQRFIKEVHSFLGLKGQIMSKKFRQLDLN